MPERHIGRVACSAIIISLGAVWGASRPATSARQSALDPAAWGGTHAGKPYPEFLRGDECLFCHRVHTASAGKRRLIPRAPICFDCHDEAGRKLTTKTYRIESSVCEYYGVGNRNLN